MGVPTYAEPACGFPYLPSTSPAYAIDQHVGPEPCLTVVSFLFFSCGPDECWARSV